MTGDLQKGEIKTRGYTQGRRCGETQEDGHLQALERGLEQMLPSQPSEGADPDVRTVRQHRVVRGAPAVVLDPAAPANTRGLDEFLL